MFLPTFWKMFSEAAMHKSMKVAGWGLPAGLMGKYNILRRHSAHSTKSLRVLWLRQHYLFQVMTKTRPSLFLEVTYELSLIFVIFCSRLDRFPFFLQLDLLNHHSSPVWCCQEERLIRQAMEIKFVQQKSHAKKKRHLRMQRSSRKARNVAYQILQKNAYFYLRLVCIYSIIHCKKELHSL